MDTVPAIGIVIGLVGSLANTILVLENLASRFASERLGSGFKDAETAMSISYSDLVKIQVNLHTKWMQSQPEELLLALEGVEKRLKRLRDDIQDAETLRAKLFFRRQSRILLKYDMDLANFSIVLALEMVRMIRAVQSRVQHAEPLIEDSRSNSRNITCLAEDLARTWQHSHAPLGLTAPDTRAQQIFALMAVPEEQDRFHQQCQAERVTGTCDWFLETKEYESWREHPVSTGDEDILWCQGKPGIGKTVLASKIIDRLRTSHFVVYFYMGSGGRVHSATDLTASLLRQLCLPFHIAPRRLIQLYERSDHKTNMRLELDDMLEALRETSRDIDQPVIVVIDGLDECNMLEQKDFIKVLTGLKETSWKSLVTSRFDHDIVTKACEGCTHFSITDDNVANDIRIFVESVLRGNEPVDNMLSDQTFRSEVIETLTSRAQGMFYWVSLQLRRILDQTHVSGIKKVLVDIPSEVGGIVKGALDMINMQDPNRTRLATRTLALLTAAKAPMTARALSHAMGISHVLDPKRRLSELSEDEIPNPASIIECCMGLVAIDPVTKVVMLAHFDIAQYMQTHWKELFSWKEQLLLANTTLSYLSLQVFSPGPCHQVGRFARLLEEYPFLDYASRHWGLHAREAMLLQEAAAEEGKQKLIENVNSFLHNRMNLEFSLQVCDLRSKPLRAREVLFEKDFALHADKFRSVSELQVATRHGFSAIAERILKTCPAMVSYQDDFGMSALHEAAQAGWYDLVDMLLKAGAQPSPRNKEEKAPVYYAAKNGYTGIIQLISKEESGNEVLSEHSRSSDLTSGRNETVPMRKDQGDPLALEEAFCDAAEAGRLDVIRLLLEYDIGLADSKKHEKTAMIFAIHGGHEKILEMLLDANACHSSEDYTPSDQIPLHLAVRYSNENMVSILLERGADVETCDELGRTALFETLDCHDLHTATLLFDAGINISSSDREGNTVLHEAVRRGAVEHASLLIDQGIQVNDFNTEGLTPLHLAARHGHCRIANDLLKSAADVDVVDQILEWTPLMYGASTGATQLCQILLSCGANVAMVSSEHETPLLIAANAGNHQVAHLLLDYGADVNGLDTESKTPLLLAAAAGDAQLVRLLLQYGADVNVLDNRSNSSLGLAADAGHVSIAQLLLEKGANPYGIKWEPKGPAGKATGTSNRLIWQMLHEYGMEVDAIKKI